MQRVSVTLRNVTTDPEMLYYCARTHIINNSNVHSNV